MDDLWDVFKFCCGVMLLLLMLAIVAIPFGLMGRGCNLVNSAANTVAKEVDPAYMLKKYEWFKDASAVLDKKKADVSVYERRFEELKKDYAGVARKEWARDDREQYGLWLSEVSGIKASFNQLASEYNSQMSKINWRFTNVGNLPQGANEPLPREYTNYETV